jgi:hypothetical protein
METKSDGYKSTSNGAGQNVWIGAKFNRDDELDNSFIEMAETLKTKLGVTSTKQFIARLIEEVDDKYAE